MKTTKKELRVVMSSFNSISNRLMKADYYDYMDVLKKFCIYIESTELIMNYIYSCGGYIDDMENKVDEIIKNSNMQFQFSIDNSEEISEVYSVIKVLSVRDYSEPPYGLLLSYSSSRKLSDCLDTFNHRVVLILINHIDDYLKRIGIEMGMDENVTYNINGQQVNIANDNASITAVQNNNGIDADELHKLIEIMKAELNPSLPDEDKVDAEESIEIIEAELKSGKPDEEKVMTHFKLLKRIDTGVKFLSACASLLTFADKIYPFLGQITSWFI